MWTLRVLNIVLIWAENSILRNSFCVSPSFFFHSNLKLFLSVGLQVFLDCGANELKKLKSELFLNREGNDEVLYYSCKAHLDELINSLEEDGKEKKLLSMIKAKYKVMIKHMEITETLTEELRGMDDSERLHNVHECD